MQLNRKDGSPERRASKQSEMDDVDDEAQRTIFCGNLHEQISEEILYELFLQSGPIESVRIPKDKDGRPRTFGFITFNHACTVSYAIELFNGIKLYDRKLTIQSRNGSKTGQMPVQRNFNEYPYRNHHNYDIVPMNSRNDFHISNSSLRNGFQNFSQNKSDNSMKPKELNSNSRNNSTNLVSKLNADFYPDSVSSSRNFENDRNDKNHSSKYRSRDHRLHNRNPFYTKPDTNNKNSGGGDGGGYDRRYREENRSNNRRHGRRR